MGLIAVGVAMIVFAVAVWGSLIRSLRRRGRSTTVAWRRFARSGALWIGIVVVVAAISPVAASVLVVLLLAVVAVEVIRGIRAFPAVWRAIGDPDEWRGNEQS